MEIYLFLALFIVYILTSLILSKEARQKIWVAAFVVSFLVMAVAISFLHTSNQELMMNAVELGWYYILYLFVSLSVVLGVINFWMFRSSFRHILFSKEDDDDSDNLKL